MAKKPTAAAIRSLFSADNPFRRKTSIEEPAPPALTVTAAATSLGRHPNPEPQVAEPSANKCKDAPPPAVVEKRKAPQEAAAVAGPGEEEEAFDDEIKLLRTVPEIFRSSSIHLVFLG
ncbi:hypothetical protein ABZP36_034257 [Zizania latifolia]